MKEYPIYMINPISDIRVWNDNVCLELKKEDNWFIKFATFNHVYITNDINNIISIAIDYSSLFYYFLVPFESKYDLYNEYK